MLNKLLNWFRRPKWEEFRDDHTRLLAQMRQGASPHLNGLHALGFAAAPDNTPQWRTNFSLTAAQRSERSRKAAATRKANKAKSNGE